MALLISCAGTGPATEIPAEILAAPAKPELPTTGASNHQKAQYLLRAEDWMDAATDQITDLAEIICTFTGQDC